MKAKEKQLIYVVASAMTKSVSDRISGILRYVAENNLPWSLTFRPTQLIDNPELRVGSELRPDGMIVTLSKFTKMMRLGHCSPANHLVIMSIHEDGIAKLPKNAVSLGFDNVNCARTAADLLIKRGLEHFAYVHAPSSAIEAPISYRRGEAFKAYIEGQGFDCAICQRKAVRGNWAVQLRRLADELSSLPRPCGVMGYNDDRAREVIDACNLAGLKIPEHIQVVGVDNDTHICENIRPRLTSIDAGFIDGGMRAAELLDSLIRNGRRPAQREYTYGVFTVVERDTTMDVKGSARLVTAAQKIIREKACGGITPQDIADALNVSRRLIEIRFREVLNVGVAEAIRTEKLKEVCRRLRDTNRPIDEISYACGFKTPTHLKALFRNTYGTTMRAFRTQSQAKQNKNN